MLGFFAESKDLWHMEQKIYDIILRKTGNATVIRDDMNLVRDLGANLTQVSIICHEIEIAFNMRHGTFSYLTKYFDKLCVSDLIKLARSEISYNQSYVAPSVPLFTKIRTLFQKQH